MFFSSNLLAVDSNELSDFGHYASTDQRCLIAWAQLSAAQLCVDTKLRTPLGKPIDTFVGFERLIKGFARSFVLDETKISNINVLLANQHNLRVLLGFIEALEKIIYNASDGTAFAMPTPERPSRMFFGVNTATCKEYFKRNRMTVNLLATHGLDADIVIRNSEITLRDMIDGGGLKYIQLVSIIIFFDFLQGNRTRSILISPSSISCTRYYETGNRKLCKVFMFGVSKQLIANSNGCNVLLNKLPVEKKSRLPAIAPICRRTRVKTFTYSSENSFRTKLFCVWTC